MIKPISFGSRATADKVLAGIDLTGKRFIVTGCNSGIGFETMNALAANGAHVTGLARSGLDAATACAKAGPSCTPMACDLGDLESIAAAVAAVRNLQEPLDAIIANAGIANPPALKTRYGVEQQFLVNHLGHFALINDLLDQVRNGSGRIVIVSSDSSITQAPAEGIMFDNLDGRQFYDPFMFYGQSKLATSLYAKELSRRLNVRGIAANSLHPGATRGTGLNRSLKAPLKIALWAAQGFMKSPARGAATPALLAASPQVSGITGEYWSNCRIARGNPLLEDAELARRLWEVSEQIIATQRALPVKSLRVAA
jgi:WW domain-containing oxidoreductase